MPVWLEMLALILSLTLVHTIQRAVPKPHLKPLKKLVDSEGFILEQILLREWGGTETALTWLQLPDVYDIRWPPFTPRGNLVLVAITAGIRFMPPGA